MTARREQFGFGNTLAGAALGAAALLLISGLFAIFYGAKYANEEEAREAGMQAQILASVVTASLAFDDPRAAREFVEAMSVNPLVRAAAVYTEAGTELAHYVRSPDENPPPRVPPEGMVTDELRLTIVRPVVQGGLPLGWVYLATDNGPQGRRIIRWGLVALFGTMTALVVVVLAIAQRNMARANAELGRRAAALAAANTQLQVQIAERETVEAALRQAQKMEAIGQLTGGVAHDFNNLLQVILGSLETMRRRIGRWGLAGESAAEFARLLDAASRGGERAAALTRQLLAFARRQPLSPRPLDINRLVAGMSDLLQRTLGEAIAVETILAGGLWTTLADPNQLESALLNLAVNARDAMPEGGRLTIETANSHLDETYVRDYDELKPGQYVSIAVTDSGVGMTRETAAHAFEPFFSTKDIGRGTGLGLSQVYGFIKQSGGNVRIYSELGQGTTVRIYLPRHRGSKDEAAVQTADPFVPAGAPGRRILVVEDEANVRALSVDMLREAGYHVLEAADGHEALAVLDQVGGIELLFTDVGLPGHLNGRKLADEAQRRFPELKVLYATGYARNAIIHNGRLDPGVELIGKPFTFAALTRKVRQVLGD